MKRLASLENKFGHNTKLEEAKSERERRQITKNAITEASTEEWPTSAARERSLQQLYVKYKLAPGCEPYYRDDRESALLFQASTDHAAMAMGTVRRRPVVPPMQGHRGNPLTYHDGLPVTRNRGASHAKSR